MLSRILNAVLGVIFSSSTISTLLLQPFIHLAEAVPLAPVMATVSRPRLLFSEFTGSTVPTGPRAHRPQGGVDAGPLLSTPLSGRLRPPRPLLHTHTPTPTLLHTPIHTHSYTQLHTLIHTFTHSDTHLHTYTYTQIHSYTPTHSHTYINTHTATHPHLHTYTHTHTHTYTPTQPQTHIHTPTQPHTHTSMMP